MQMEFPGQEIKSSSARSSEYVHLHRLVTTTLQCSPLTEMAMDNDYFR